MSGTSRRKGSKGGRSAAPPASSALAWAESLAAQPATEAPAEASPSPWAGGSAAEPAFPAPFGAVSGGDGGGEWEDTGTLGVGISPEVAERARRAAATASPFGTTSSPFPGPAADAPSEDDPFTSGAPGGRAGQAKGRRRGKDAAPAKETKGRKGRGPRPDAASAAALGAASPSFGDAHAVAAGPGLLAGAPDEPAVPEAADAPSDPFARLSTGRSGNTDLGAQTPSDAPQDEGAPDGDGPAAIPPKRRRVRPGEVKEGAKPPSIAPGTSRKGKGRGAAAPPKGVRRLVRRLGVPPFFDKKLVLGATALVALGGGLASGWAMETLEAPEELPPTTPQQCATAQLAWAQANNSLATLNQEDPPTLRYGFVDARDDLTGVTPPPAVAEDWATVFTFVSTAAGVLEQVDPADGTGLVAALDEIGPQLRQQEMQQASVRISAYLSADCAG